MIAAVAKWGLEIKLVGLLGLSNRASYGMSENNLLVFDCGRAYINDPMARITVEDCLDKVSSRFELVMLASKRARQLRTGAKPCVESDNRDIVVALREIAANKVRWAVPKSEPAK